MIGVSLLVGMLFIPETPRWLAKKGMSEKALAVLRKVHKLEEQACTELQEIEESIIEASFKELLQLLCNFKMVKRYV